MIRQRVTLFNPKDSNEGIIKSVNSTSLAIQPTSTFIREDKYTIPNTSLKFKYIEQLRIQLINDQFPNSIYNFHYQHGLSIYVKPQNIHSEEDKSNFYDELNSFINNLFNLNLNKESWIISIDSLYYQSRFKEYDNLVKLINQELKYESLINTSNIDVFYDISKIIVKSINNISGELIFNLNENINKEIGLFLVDEEISSNDDIVLSGVRVLINSEKDEDNIHRTLFHIKPRHRHLPLSYQSYIKTKGLHPILINELEKNMTDPIDEDIENCKLYYYINLNKSLFLDKYQLQPNQKLLSNFGNQNLELPEYKIDEWGNEILIELDNVEQNTIELNLHSRYHLPKSESDNTKVLINSPLLFFGCNVKDSHLLSYSPFDNKLDIGGNYEKFFTNNTVFYHLNSSNTELTVTIPNGVSNFADINSITLTSILLGIGMILYKLAKVLFKKASITKEKKSE